MISLYLQIDNIIVLCDGMNLDSVEGKFMTQYLNEIQENSKPQPSVC